MVNHPNRKKTYPDQTFEKMARSAGAIVTCLWELPGPPRTGIAWIAAYSINGTLCLVQTFRAEIGWEVFTPCQSRDVAKTIADALNRCGVPAT